MAAPDPALGLLRHQFVEPCRLGVVHKADVPAVAQLTGVHLVEATPGVPLLGIEILGGALEGVMHQLGGVEELFAAVDDLPLAVEPDIAHQGDERVEDLRDPAAEGGRRDVHDTMALQRLGQLADLRDQLAAADVCVVAERLVRYRYGLEHAAGRYLKQAPPARRVGAGATASRSADYGLVECSTGVSTARPSCLSCLRTVGTLHMPWVPL